MVNCSAKIMSLKSNAYAVILLPLVILSVTNQKLGDFSSK